MKPLHSSYRLRSLSWVGLTVYSAIISADAQMTINRVITDGSLVPDRGDYVNTFTIENTGFATLTGVSVTVNLSSPNALNPMWFGDMFASLTHGTASEDERMAVLFNRPGVSAQDPWGDSSSSLSQTYDVSGALAGAWLPSNRWSLLVSDSQQGGIARVDSLSLTLTGSLAESGEAVFRPGDTVSGGGVVSGQVNLTSTSPNASVAANIGEADSLHFGGGMVGTANLVKHGRGELVIGRPNGGGGAGAPGVASNNDYSGEIEVSEGSLKLVGNNALGSGARINLGGGGVELRLAEDTAVSNAITLAAASTLSKVQVSSGGASISSGMQGAGGFEKSGAGTLTIGGINTYEGVTHVSSGTLKVSGEITQSDVTVTGNARLSLTSSGNLGGDVVVQEGAALGGLGTFSGNVTVQGLHSPGNSPGLQTAEAGLTYGSSARLEWELFSNTAEASARGTSYDAIEITGGNLLINTGAVIDLSFSDPAGTPNPSTVSWANAFWSSNQSWQMIKLSGSGAYGTPASQFTIGTIGNDASGVAFATARPGSSFTTSNLTDGVYINYVIPEPSSALLGGLASLLLLRRRR